VARSLALFAVVLGHLVLAVIDRDPSGSLRGDNLIALYPHLSWLTLIAPMPIFFAAGGWANATSTAHSSATRLRTLMGLGAVVVTVWSGASIIELLVVGQGSTLADGARIATQPLWFLAAYIPFAAYGKRMATFARHPIIAVGIALVVLTAIDVARFGFDANNTWGWPSFFLAWSIPWMIGSWWRNASNSQSFNERRVGCALFIAGSVAAIVLVKTAHYYPALIDAVPNKRSNTTPPTLFTAVAAISQTGILMMIAPSLDSLARRWRSAINALGTASIAVYMWHLSALALCAGLIALGIPTPTRLTASWWLTRPLWFALVLGITALFAMATSFVRKHLQSRAPRPPMAETFHAGVALAILGAGIIGLYGPRTLPGATIAIASFIGSWWCLRTTEQ
jgi:hypothetical protein